MVVHNADERSIRKVWRDRKKISPTGLLGCTAIGLLSPSLSPLLEHLSNFDHSLYTDQFMNPVPYYKEEVT